MIPASEDRYRAMLETEGGESISAGARVAHIRAALESGRGLYVDLSGVPEEKRDALAAHIKSLVALVIPPKTGDLRAKENSPKSAAG